MAGRELAGNCNARGEGPEEMMSVSWAPRVVTRLVLPVDHVRPGAR